MVSIFKKPEPKEITLGDGNVYKVGPLNLGTLADLEDEFNCGLDKLKELLTTKQASTLQSLLYVLIKQNHPEITKSQIGSMVYAEQLPEVANLIIQMLNPPS